jgi:Yqey-like protein
MSVSRSLTAFTAGVRARVNSRTAVLGGTLCIGQQTRDAAVVSRVHAQTSRASIVDEVSSALMPTLADEESTLGGAQEAVEESGAKGAAQTGKSIGVLVKHHKGEVDGAIAKRLVTQILTES